MTADGRQHDSIDEAIAGVRRAVAERALGGPPAPRELDPSRLVRFSPLIPDELSAERRTELSAAIAALEPWAQGPFLVAGGLVAGSARRDDERWAALGEHIEPDLVGARVLDLGGEAGYDAFMFSLRGAESVLACEERSCREQAVLLESIYQTGIDFQALGWRDLDPGRHGRFDVIHCRDVVHRERNPVALLEQTSGLLADRGTLWLGTPLLADPQLSEYARFVPAAYSGDPTWWWVPGRLALRRMLESVGLAVEGEFADGEDETAPTAGDFPIVHGYLRAVSSRPGS